ncbi:MAG: rRNA pseudouridine synthase [Candidatus Ancillula sp.]|nr:rRNA pseudouridine synthase [Candidatus Ancillula sp.]
MSEDGVRLQKILAASGVGSRRFCEELIASGVVELNGKIVTEQGVRANLSIDEIRINGERINMNPNTITIALNKPVGVVSAMSDDRGRMTIDDVIGNKYGRLFHIGRLDQDSSGLILLTNDGDLAQVIAHPRFEIAKTYILKLCGRITTGIVQKMLKGFELEDGFMKFDYLRILGETGNNPTKVTLVEVVIHSGKNRILRRSFEHFDIKVLELVRTQIGNIRLGQLPEGKTRVLAEVEVSRLEAIALNKVAEKRSGRNNSRSNLKAQKI